MFERFAEQAHQVVDLARDEAERFGHRYVGPEHLLLGVLRDGGAAAGLLRAHGMDLGRARAAMLRLAGRGVVPESRPTDAELLETLGIDLEAVRRRTEQAFGAQMLGEATWRVTRRRGRWGARVVWTPLCGGPLVAKRALQLASEQTKALGYDEVDVEHVLLGVVEDARRPPDGSRVSRRHRRISAHVGLPDGYRGAAGWLLEACGVDPEALHDAVQAELRDRRPHGR